MAATAQHTLKKGLKGALIGAGVGIGIAVAVHTVKGASHPDDEEEHPDLGEGSYPYISTDGELLSVVHSLSTFRFHDEQTFDKILFNLNRMCSLNVLALTCKSTREKHFEMSWPVTAHYYSESVRDQIKAFKFAVQNSDAVGEKQMEEQIIELEEWIANCNYNISQHVQYLMNL